MPYVQRDRTGKIVGVYANPAPQPDGTCLTEPDPLPDDHPEVVEFFTKFPLPKIVPLTDKQRQQMRREEEAQSAEFHELRNLMLNHFHVWSQLEMALSALLYVLLNIQPKSSHIAYAIYYSPSGFEARRKIIDDAVIQFIKENPDIESLRNHWNDINRYLGLARNKRNIVAHGSPLKLTIRGKNYIRLAPPAFDVLRIWNKTTAGTIPGLSTKNLSDAICQVQQLQECVDSVNKFIDAFQENDSESLKERFLLLEANLKKIHNL
jgi:hypothetical protein